MTDQCWLFLIVWKACTWPQAILFFGNLDYEQRLKTLQILLPSIRVPLLHIWRLLRSLPARWLNGTMSALGIFNIGKGLSRLRGIKRALEVYDSKSLNQLEWKLCRELEEVINQEELLWLQNLEKISWVMVTVIQLFSTKKLLPNEKRIKSQQFKMI